MSVRKPRTRVVFFRVSEEEFQAIEDACDSIGARSISDFARTAARNLMSQNERDRLTTITHSFDVIHHHLECLHKRVEEMYQAKGSLPSVHSDKEADAAKRELI